MIGSIINSFVSFPPPSFNPLSYANAEAWWKADSMAYADTTAIGDTGTEWFDSSGNGKTLTQASSGNRPVFRTNQFGSLPAVEVTTNAKYLGFSSISLTGDFTCLAVVKQASGNDGMLLANNGNTQWFEKNWAGLNALATYNSGLSGTVSDTQSLSQTALQMVVYRRSGSSFSFRENKIARSVSISGTQTGTYNFSIFGNTNGFNSAFQGLIAEVVLYSAFRTNAECDTLYDNYFKPKWGLP